MTRFFIAVLCVLACQCNNAFGTTDDIKVLPSGRAMEVINGTNYYITPVDLFLSLDKAMALCNDLGMRMVSMQTQEKQQMIVDHLYSHGYGGQHYWTSGIRYYHETFIWSGTGQLLTWFNWGTSQPSELHQKNVCICLNAGDGYRWDDADCDASNVLIGALCEQ